MANDARESRTRPDQYTIAWICALHMEMAAARAMLDGVHGDLPRDGNDSNAYTLGNIGRHNVVIACLSAAQYGLTNAATVLTHLVRTFTSIRACLMVGIGGAAPSQADIRLGDIVVGTRVMQYDLGKIVGDGQIQRTAIPKILSQLLGTAVSTLRSAHELEPSQIPSILLEKFEGYSGYGRPTSPDCLFLSTYDHVSPTPDCDECDHSKLVPRRKRATVDPLVHYGAIASGNQVMRNGNQRDKISQQLEVMCFEMESAALMDILPCLPIRGICDYSDTHKNKEWQRYAAAAAASYARELLMVLPVAEAHGRVAYLAHSHRDSSNDRRQQLLDSLRFDQMDARKSTIKAAHTKTCRWFLKHHDYQAWLDPAKLTQHHGFLWIRGKPGAGKSTIMKFAYSHICKSRHAHAITAAFFFNARGEYLERSIVGMYRSLLLQLLQGCSELQAVLDDPDLVSESQSGCPPLNVLKELFLGAILALGQRSFTCFIDALDECDEQQVMDMVQYFEDLAEQSTEKRIAFRICFSSRHYPYIIVRQGIQFTVEDQPDHVEDLSTYIASRLRINDPAFVGELQPKLLEKAAGVFLWVVLVVDILNKDYRCGGLALRKRLAEIPSGLSDLFKDILRRDTENMEHLLLCVLWILCAKRPLRPEEFYYALCSGLSLKGLADPELPAVAIGDAGGNAIRIQFIHESVRDYLVKDKGLYELWPDLGFNWEMQSHERLKQCCDAYMRHPSVHVHVSKLSTEAGPDLQTEVSNVYPFLKYASQHVLYHADVAAGAISQAEFLSRFPVSNWISIVNLFEKYRSRRYSPNANLLYILAEKDFSKLIRTRIQEDPRTDFFGERYHHPLFAALAHGNKASVAALLNTPSTICNGVDITEGLTRREDLRRYKNRTPLSWASQNGRIGIVRLILQNGTTVNEVDGNGRTPLSRAIENNHESLTTLLIENGADVTVRDWAGRTPLALALAHGKEAIARLLIENGADVNVRDSDGWTPLSQASANDNEAIARLLIENGADVNVSDSDGLTQTPLSQASANGNEAIARLLIENGADVTVRDWAGRTPLSWASMKDNEPIARLLIENGADVTARDWEGRTPLARALANGNEAVARLLIENGGAA